MAYERRIQQTASLLSILVIWALATMVVSVVPSLPSPVEVAVAFAGAAASGSFWEEAARSTFRVYLSFVVAAVIAIPLGLFIGRSETISDLTFPALEVLRPIPPIAWYPALTIILLTPANIVRFIIFLAAFFPILLNTVEGVRGVEEEFPQAARSLGASQAQTMRHVILPGALPSIYTGLVNAMGLAWISLVAAELLSSSGLGYFIWNAFTAGAYPNIIVGMIAVGVLGYGSSALVRRLGSRRIAWLQTSAA